MLESVGMTKRQLRRMLMLEGLGYACITTLLTGTLGIAITYGIFELFRQQADYAVFKVPFVQMLAAMSIVFAVCVAVPVLVYRYSSSTGIVERLREAE
jgi:putative ABC transport system permease protein